MAPLRHLEWLTTATSRSHASHNDTIRVENFGKFNPQSSGPACLDDPPRTLLPTFAKLSKNFVNSQTLYACKYPKN